MTQYRKTLFISDLHLDPATPHINQAFTQMLHSYDQTVDALYILGDLFEAWVGDDDDTPFHREIIQALNAAIKRGLKIYYLHGNRDFLIGKRFLQQSGCQLLGEEEQINLYGTPVLIMHGDTLCTQDKDYLKARKWLRNTYIQKLFLLLPIRIRRKIADGMRKQSMQHTSKVPSEWMDVTQDEVVRVMTKHDVKHLIHGHTHRPAFHHFFIQDKELLRIVLGAWHEKGNMLIWNETGEKSWVEF